MVRNNGHERTGDLNAPGDYRVSPELLTLVRFVHALRDAGMTIPPEAIRELVAGTVLLGFHDVYFVGRCTLVKRQGDLVTYDDTFKRFFSGESHELSDPLQVVRDLSEFRSDSRANAAGQAEDTIGAASNFDLLREKRFSDCTEAELDEVARLMAQLSIEPPERQSRRHHATRRGQLDARRTLRASLRYGGEPLEQKHRGRSSRARRLVVILDVSASMSAYTRMLMLFSHVLVRQIGGTEVFCFGTRLTRVTKALATPIPQVVLGQVAEVVFDRSAGTRIADSLHEFLKAYGHRGLGRGAVVMICSDGLERGDPEALAGRMQHLHRLAYRVIWLNPLREDPRYQPLARGMAAALPYIDSFVSGHSLRSLESVGQLLARSLVSRRPAPSADGSAIR